MNHFSYFTEIEDRFAQRRGSLLLLSTLDWALIETWREAGVPLEAVLRGIDAAFDKHEAQRARLGSRRQRKVNGLAWCAQSVMEAAEQAREAMVGMAAGTDSDLVQNQKKKSGFESARLARFLTTNATQLEAVAAKLPESAASAAAETAARLRELAESLSFRSIADTSNELSFRSVRREPGSPASNLAGVEESNAEESASQQEPPISLEVLDRTLTVLEEKLFAALLAATPEAELVALRSEADNALAPYRGKMGAVQIKQVQQQFLHKRLLESHSLPRLSLFYMPHEDGDVA